MDDLRDTEKKAVKDLCFHHRIGGESVLKAVEYAGQHGFQKVGSILEAMKTESPKNNEGPYTQFHRMLEAKVGVLDQTAETAKYQESQDNMKYKYGKNDEDAQRDHRRKLAKAGPMTPLEVFYGYERTQGRTTAIRMQKRYGLEPDEKLMDYWREAGYGGLLEHYSRA